MTVTVDRSASGTEIRLFTIEVPEAHIGDTRAQTAGALPPYGSTENETFDDRHS